MMETADKFISAATAIIAALLIISGLSPAGKETEAEVKPVIPYYLPDSLEALKWQRPSYIDSVFKHKTDTVIIPYRALFEKHADSLGLDWRLVAAVAYQESRFDLHAQSGKGATGLMQITGGTSRLYGVDNAHDPSQNISAGASYLGYLSGKFHEIQFTLAAYNAGVSRISGCIDSLTAQGLEVRGWEDLVPALSEIETFNWEETDKFVRRVQNIYLRFRKIE